MKSNHGEIEGKAKMESDTCYNLVYKSHDGQELSGCQAYQHGITLFTRSLGGENCDCV